MQKEVLNMSFLDHMRTNLQYEKDLLGQVKTMKIPEQTPQTRQNLQNLQGLHLSLRGNGRQRSYYLRDLPHGPSRYAKKQDMNLVNNLKLTRFQTLSIRLLESNIQLQENFLRQYQEASFAAVNARLPKAYRFYFDEKMPLQNKKLLQVMSSQNPYHKENLVHKTSFGLLMRSKGEIMIAEILQAAGLEFYYERPLELMDENGNIVVVYPDFTILLGHKSFFYWEHKGMMNEAEYFMRDREKMLLYYQNGIYEPKNLIVTHDGPDGSFDVEAVKRLVYGFLLPMKF